MNVKYRWASCLRCGKALKYEVGENYNNGDCLLYGVLCQKCYDDVKDNNLNEEVVYNE
jgi:hypothetical protein